MERQRERESESAGEGFNSVTTQGVGEQVAHKSEVEQQRQEKEEEEEKCCSSLCSQRMSPVYTLNNVLLTASSQNRHLHNILISCRYKRIMFFCDSFILTALNAPHSHYGWLPFLMDNGVFVVKTALVCLQTADVNNIFINNIADLNQWWLVKSAIICF